MTYLFIAYSIIYTSQLHIVLINGEDTQHPNLFSFFFSNFFFYLAKVFFLVQTTFYVTNRENVGRNV